jgi:hypothetical protein
MAWRAVAGLLATALAAFGLGAWARRRRRSGSAIDEAHVAGR